MLPTKTFLKLSTKSYKFKIATVTGSSGGRVACGSAVEIHRTIFQNVRQKMPVCQTKCPTKIFRPKKNISSSVTRSLQKMAAAVTKQNTNVKKSRFGGGTSSKQSKIQSKLHKVIISTRLEIWRAVAGI